MPIMSIYAIEAFFYLYSALSLSAAVLIAALFWGKDDVSSKFWAWGCLLTSIATAITPHRKEIPLAISFSLMVSLELLSIQLIRESLIHLSSRKPVKLFSESTWISPIVFFLVLEVWRYLNNNNVAQGMSALVTFMFGISNVMCAGQASITSKEFTNRIFFNFLAVIFWGIATLYFARAANIVTGRIVFVFDSEVFNLTIWFLIILLGSIRNLSYIVLRLHLGFTEHSRLNNMNLRLSNILEERNELIISLQRLNRLASMNALSSTIAHEINQPLGASSINAQFAKLKLDSEPQNIPLLKEIVMRIIRDINRASSIIKNLSRISSNEINTISTISLNKSIDEVLEISRKKLQNLQIVTTVNCSPEHYIKANPIEWGQVLLNLINNSIEALQDGGSTQKLIEISAIKINKVIRITFQDNGKGLNIGQELKIFELFSSYKDTGTGIGLWLSKDIVEKYGGKITASNRHEGGACFTIELPIR